MDELWLITAGLILGRFLVGGLLILAGVLKLKAGSRWFLQQILAYELVKGKVAWLLARGLPWAEVVCGALLIIGLLTPLVVLVSFALLWGFTAAVVSTFVRGKSVDCGCFGRAANPQAQKARWTVAYRNLTLMALLIVVYSLPAKLAVDVLLSDWLYPIGHNVTVQVGLVVLWLIALLATLTLQVRLQRKQPIQAVSLPQSQ